MFRKSNGFTLLETIVALNVWFFLVLGILPQLIHIEKERQNLAVEGIAGQVLQDELSHYLYDGASFMNQDVEKENKHYTVSWEVMDSKMMKICVSWEDNFGENKLKCGYGKQ